MKPDDRTPDGAEDVSAAVAAASWAGLSLGSGQLDLLERYVTWLRQEALPAGGLGPSEGDRLWSRHVADSLVMIGPLGLEASNVVDIGTGVGLPGIPLAVAMPAARFTLVDRAERRTRLLRRAVAVLGVPNVEVVKADVGGLHDRWSGLVMRGAVAGERIAEEVARLLDAPGVAVVALSRRAEVPDTAAGIMRRAGELSLASELIQVPAEVLDSPAWLLRMST